LPPLRDRKGDLALLSRAFLSRFAQTYGRPAVGLSLASLAAFEAYAWPGNVRELENVLLREFLLREGDDEELHVESVLGERGSGGVSRVPIAFKCAKARALADFERAYLRELLVQAGGNLSLAARLSQKDRGALKRLAKKHGIRTAEFRDDSAPPSSERSNTA
jgi:transcriptional regulator with GAF, ATPase, and Fis domain